MPELGRGLISAQPNPNSSELDEGKVVGCELVVAGSDTPTLLDLIEEPLDQVASSVEVRAEADRRSCHINLVTDRWQRSSVVRCRKPLIPDTDFHR